jgi:phosphatidylinositol alpha-1,6-mannosyltransferase
VSVSRLVEGHKNFEMLIRLCAVLRPLGVVERLTIIGGGPRLAALRKKVAALGVDDVVDLPGYLPQGEVGDILGSAHVGLLASRDSMAERVFEGFGLVVHELAGAGLPVLAGAAGGTTEALHEPWGYSLDPDDLWAWVEAVEQLFNDENRRREMGSAALAWANSIDPLGSARAFARVLLEKRSIETPNGTSDDPHPSFALGLRQR